MSDFLQLHLLTAYPPANLNRDDTGRPKTAVLGGVMRMRVSSQSLKRAWRTSDAFKSALDGHIAKRTHRIGDLVLKHVSPLVGGDEEKAKGIARYVSDHFAKLNTDGKKRDYHTDVLVLTSPDEEARALKLAGDIARGAIDIKKASPVLDIDATSAVDIAMFGRMLTSDSDSEKKDKGKRNLAPQERTDASFEAAVQVAHAITTHKVIVEDDYYTAVDDLKTAAEDAGAGFVGEQGFGSGVFYLYACVDRGLLVKNLGGDGALAARAIAALIDAAAKVGPRGKQASFASRARAHYVLAERGTEQPRTLAAAFVKPVGIEGENDYIEASLRKLGDLRQAFDGAYGQGGIKREDMTVGGQGTLEKVIAFATADMPGAGEARAA